MTRVFGPDFVALQVRDLDAARRFYVEQLGLEVTPQSPPKVGAFLTELIPFAVRESMVDLDEVERLGWGLLCGLSVATPMDCAIRSETGVCR